jgi:alkylation response protein AidB-like acyl-CoA dehydrogenase
MATPSSSTAGFFQALPTIEPQYTSPTEAPGRIHASATAQALSDDPVLARILNLYLPRNAIDRVGPAVHHLSRRVLHPKTLQHAVDAEINTPTLKPLNTFGEINKNDPLWTTEGWKALKAIGIEEGVVSRAYNTTNNGYNRRIEQFSICHAWSHTSTLTMCPMTMTDGAATLLLNHLNDSDGDQPGRGAVFAEAYRRLISKDPSQSWTSGQWMTERTGGSDVRGTETIARRLTVEEVARDDKAGRGIDSVGLPLGPWSIDGFKWFSSATDSDMTMLLAQTGKGLSAFMVPMRRAAGGHSTGSDTVDAQTASELNGIRIQRLKNKMGTKGLPTAELELEAGLLVKKAKVSRRFRRF